MTRDNLIKMFKEIAQRRKEEIARRKISSPRELEYRNERNDRIAKRFKRPSKPKE